MSQVYRNIYQVYSRCVRYTVDVSGVCVRVCTRVCVSVSASACLGYRYLCQINKYVTEKIGKSYRIYFQPAHLHNILDAGVPQAQMKGQKGVYVVIES